MQNCRFFCVSFNQYLRMPVHRETFVIPVFNYISFHGKAFLDLTCLYAKMINPILLPEWNYANVLIKW